MWGQFSNGLITVRPAAENTYSEGLGHILMIVVIGQKTYCRLMVSFVHPYPPYSTSIVSILLVPGLLCWFMIITLFKNMLGVSIIITMCADPV